MIVGKNWKSGSDTTALGKVHAKVLDKELEVNHKYKFSKDGFLADLGIFPDEFGGELTKVEYLAEHGFAYISSKEMFLYANKRVDIIHGGYTLDPPSHIHVALEGEHNLSSETSIGDIPALFANVGDIPGIETTDSGLTYSVYLLEDIPSYMTPIIVTDVDPVELSSTSTIDVGSNFNEIDRDTLTILRGRVTGLEEPMTEIYEVETLKTLHNTDNGIIKHSDHVYDPLSNLLYIKGIHDLVTIEYETSATKEVTLGTNFAASRVGKQSGMLLLAPDSEARSQINVGKTTKTNISVRGTHIFITQEPNNTVQVGVFTIYTNELDEQIEYENIENNGAYAKIQTELYDSEIYLDKVRVSKTDENGFAIVPIVAYTEDFIHGNLVVTGNKRLEILPALNSLLPGKIEILIKDITDQSILETIEMRSDATENDTTLAFATEKVQFVNIDDSSVSLTKVINIDKTIIKNLHDVYVVGVEPEILEFPSISYVDMDSIIYSFAARTRGSIVTFNTLVKQGILPDGSGHYGL